MRLSFVVSLYCLYYLPDGCSITIHLVNMTIYNDVDFCRKLLLLLLLLSKCLHSIPTISTPRASRCGQWIGFAKACGWICASTCCA